MRCLRLSYFLVAARSASPDSWLVCVASFLARSVFCGGFQAWFQLPTSRGRALIVAKEARASELLETEHLAK